MILPTKKFLSNTPFEQLAHMMEELGEVARALREHDEVHAKEEAADLQLSCETFIAILGGEGEEERLFAIEKNRARGYYQEKPSDCRQCKFFKENNLYDLYQCQITKKPFSNDKEIPACEMFTNKNEKGDK